MDQDFIARNQVVERYLSGRLPVKGAADFERFCHEHPEALDQIGLPERVNAGLRLLEASGKPEPWQEAARPAWQKPQVTLALAATVGALLIALAVVTGGSFSKNHRIAELQKESHDRALDPATSTRDIRLLPSRSGTSACQPTRNSISRSRSGVTNARSSSAGNVWSTQPPMLSPAMLTRCQPSPSVTPTGVHASGTSHAVTWPFSGRSDDTNASVLPLPPRT